MLTKIRLINRLKNIYSQFFLPIQGNLEYYLKLEGYYFSRKRNCTMIVIQVRNKRITDKIPINKAITDKILVRELHPVDACIIGILANNERNGIIDKTSAGWKKMKRFRHRCCFVKSDPILQVSKKYFSSNKQEITVLCSPCLNKEINIPTIELSKSEALLYALDSFQAVSIGYSASESYLRKKLMS